MFGAIKRMNGGGASTALTVFRMNWIKKMEALETKLSEINAELSKAEAFYRDAALAADEGGQAEAKKRDQAFSKIDKLHRQKRDAEAAHVAAQERVQRDDDKRRRSERQERERAISEQYKRLVGKAEKIDSALAELSNLTDEYFAECNQLISSGVRPKTLIPALQDIPRVVGSYFLNSRIQIGLRHPFDTKPQRLVDRCPNLGEILKSGGVG
tara:strand:+ start:4378 stop:5013 length:636 start_codon:yes stop_codon:yes gene_type:complete